MKNKINKTIVKNWIREIERNRDEHINYTKKLKAEANLKIKILKTLTNK